MTESLLTGNLISIIFASILWMIAIKLDKNVSHKRTIGATIDLLKHAIPDHKLISLLTLCLAVLIGVEFSIIDAILFLVGVIMGFFAFLYTPQAA